jgi:diguanylate cyclase (GGDEF)-like protein/PAS domain S-box-containing protein
LLRARTADARTNLHVTIAGLAVFTVASILLVVLLARAMRRDVANREIAHESLFAAHEMLRSVLDTIPQRVFWKDRESRYLGCNDLFARDAGAGSPAEVVGKTDAELAMREHAAKYRRDDEAVMSSGQAKLGYEEPVSRADGSTGWLETSKVPLRDIEGGIIGVLGTYQDITGRKAAEAQLERHAYFDALTGLANRHLLADRIRQEIAHAQRRAAVFAVAMVGLDGFKLVNDGYGHAIGDGVLAAAAQRLQGLVRSDDTVARYGGDEFALVLSCRGDERFATAIERILEAFEAPLTVQDRDIFITCSVGVSTFPQDGSDAATLLSHAGAAMYRAKERGRDRFEVFHAEMGARIRERICMERGLRRALEEGQLFLDYQPQLDLGTNEINGVEALARWKHPESGLISPARFIPVAEQSGLIVPLGTWILRDACMQARTWNARGLKPVIVAVNLSALQFRQAGFTELVADILDESGLDPSQLELEITESLLMSEAEEALRVLTTLKDMGICLSIDDFGTGYSSLSYLRRLPVDKLKIDQSFVRDIPANANAVAIARSITSLAQSLDLRVIAEGVETAEQLEFLRTLRCDEIQGYYCSRPVPPAEIPPLLARGTALLSG